MVLCVHRDDGRQTRRGHNKTRAHSVRKRPLRLGYTFRMLIHFGEANQLKIFLLSPFKTKFHFHGILSKWENTNQLMTNFLETHTLNIAIPTVTDTS